MPNIELTTATSQQKKDILDALGSPQWSRDGGGNLTGLTADGTNVLPLTRAGGTSTVDAIVQHRVGTKASLLALSNAPVGEIAIPTDENSLVIFKSGGPVTLQTSTGGRQIVDTTGTVTGAFNATIASTSTAVHVRIPVASSADITLTLPASPTIGTTIVFSGDAMLQQDKTIAIQTVAPDVYTTVNLVTTFNPVERLTLSFAQIANFISGSPAGPVYSWIVTGREQIVALVDDVENNEGNIPFSFDESSFGAAGGIVRSLTPNRQAAIGRGSVSYGSGSLALGGRVQTGTGYTGSGAQIAIGMPGGGSANSAIPNTSIFQVAFENSIGIGTPNIDNRDSTYIRCGSHAVSHSFALRRTTVGAGTTELFSFNTTLNSSSAPNISTGVAPNRFCFVRPGVYTFTMDGIVRTTSTSSNAYFIRKQFAVLRDAGGTVTFIGSPVVVGTAQKSGFAANISGDPFALALGGTGNAQLVCTFTPAAITDGTMTVQACFSGFIALAGN